MFTNYSNPTKTSKTSFFSNLLLKFGKFIEKYPKTTLCMLFLGMAGTGSVFGSLFGPIGFFFGTTVSTVMAMKKTDGATKKLCPEFYQDPTNNCKEFDNDDFKKYFRSIEHLSDDSAKLTSVFPLQEWSCKEFETSSNEVNELARQQGLGDSTVFCRSTGKLECTCERYYKPPKPKLNIM